MDMEMYQCSDIDMIIAQCVDEIWDIFDDDKSGFLDRDETKRFVECTMKDMNDDENFELADEDFEHTFNYFDTDQNGTIERSEMIKFIKKVSGF